MRDGFGGPDPAALTRAGQGDLRPPLRKRNQLRQDVISTTLSTRKKSDLCGLDLSVGYSRCWDTILAGCSAFTMDAVGGRWIRWWSLAASGLIRSLIGTKRPGCCSRAIRRSSFKPFSPSQVPCAMSSVSASCPKGGCRNKSVSTCSVPFGSTWET